MKELQKELKKYSI